MSQTELDGSLNVQEAVRNRYSAAAQEQEPQLCCPVNYDPQYLKVIPQEVIDRDYGCGDPSQHVREGETVLDLGSGTGKICFIASQVVGDSGNVIGVDCNNDMLGIARQYKSEVGDQIGHHNVEFRKGRIQDLKLDLEKFEEYLDANPVRSSQEWLLAEEHADKLRNESPLIESDSIDVVVSNCVLNLVHNSARLQLFEEIHRVLKRGGRAVISDIVSDEDVPEDLQNNSELWSGCISGAFREDRFLQAFENAGFYGIRILSRQEEPWAVVDGIEFRSMTIEAIQGKDGPCLERHQAVIYGGPWKAVTDDDGHRYVRGQRTAVCDKTYQILKAAPYAEQIIPVEPTTPVDQDAAGEFDCSRDRLRPPSETKQGQASLDILPGDCCGTDCC